MSNTFYLLAGTSKGLVVLEVRNNTAKISEVFFTGLPVSMLYVDERSNTWWVSLSHRHWGEKLHYSNDRGKTWQIAGLPSYHGFDYRPNIPASLKRIWVMQHAGIDKHDCLWVGTEPGGLFFSEDAGKTFQLNTALWEHPSRQDDKQWSGTSKDFPFIHSILIDPRNSNIMCIGISCAGVFKSTDGGQSWKPSNNGLVAAYLPKDTPMVGHDPHQVIQCRSNPDVIWQQNHCGIFRSIDSGESWIDVSGQNGIPSYGFALAIDHSNADKAWVIPVKADDCRVPDQLKLEVYKTEDGGSSWASSSFGLPSENAFDIVLRHAFIKHKNFLAFGTNNGNLYGSFDNGNSWKIFSQNLAQIHTLAVAM